ncbi:MAG: hypothetical protein CMP81_00740 [Fulvimarina sp.]|nr:hypothetical protein [Fulvimarina sp.]
MAGDISSKAFWTIVAGANGSGKPTIDRLLAPIGEFMNVDLVARRLYPQKPAPVSMPAGRQRRARRRRRSF